MNPAVTKGFCLGWRPPTTLRPWEWAAENVSIANSERSSKFDPSQTPWWQGPLECAADCETINVIVVAPTGSGKSTMAEALIPYVVSEDSGPFFYATQTDSNAKFWAETRLQHAIRSVKSIADLWPKDRHKSRKMEIIFPHMPLILSGANMSSFQEISVRWLYGDEVWEWDEGLIREFLARHHDRWNRKVYLVSQGGYKTSEFHQEWLKTTRMEYSWRCDCGHEQAYSWKSLRFDMIEREDGTIDEQATADSARMECENCRKAYDDTPANRRRLACSNIGNGAGGYIRPHADALRGYQGFHVDALAVWWVPWASEVIGWLEAKRMLKAGVVDKLRQWIQKRRAEFWDDSMSDELQPISRSDFTKSEHESAERFEWEKERFLTVDVGGNHFWHMVCAWGEGGKARIISEGYVPSDGKDEAALVEIQKRYGIKPGCVIVDVGFENDRIFDLIVKHGWFGVKGDGQRADYEHVLRSGSKVRRLYSRTQRSKAKSGGLAPWFWLATNPVKDIAHRLITGQGGELEVPGDVSKAFESHMKSERREIIRNAKTGQESAIWVTRNRQNHLWDCLVYQCGAALVFGLFVSD
jgi:phage terminase large subunit GpA-like protein